MDFNDFNDLANNYTGSLTPGTGGKTWVQGDFDGDGDVDFADFNDLAIDPAIVAVKKGRKSAPNEVDAITGATISSKAVVRIINQGNDRWLPRLEPPG